MWWLLKEPFVFGCELHVRGCQLMAHLRFPYQILHPFHLLRRRCLAPLDKRYPWRWRVAITNRWNFTVCSSRSFGRRWARVVFVRRVMEWRRFQFMYQPTDALNAGSSQNSFAFKRNISPPTAIPKTKER